MWKKQAILQNIFSLARKNSARVCGRSGCDATMAVCVKACCGNNYGVCACIMRGGDAAIKSVSGR